MIIFGRAASRAINFRIHIRKCRRFSLEKSNMLKTQLNFLPLASAISGAIGFVALLANCGSSECDNQILEEESPAKPAKSSNNVPSLATPMQACTSECTKSTDPLPTVVGQVHTIDGEKHVGISESECKYITPEQWNLFLERGWVVLSKDQVFGKNDGDEQFELLRQEMDSIMLGEADVPYDKLMMQLDSTTGNYEDAGAQTLGWKGRTLNYRKMQNLELDAVVSRYIRLPIIREACERIYGRVPISTFRVMFFNKPSRMGTHLPWHQDRWAFLSRDPLLTVYLALDDATPENGCVKIISGSHKRGVINPAHDSGFLNADQVEREVAGSDVVPMDLTLRAGEVALIHNWVLHQSGTNASDHPRRALSVCYMDASTHCDSTHPNQPSAHGGSFKRDSLAFSTVFEPLADSD